MAQPLLKREIAWLVYKNAVASTSAFVPSTLRSMRTAFIFPSYFLLATKPFHRRHFITPFPMQLSIKTFSKNKFILGETTPRCGPITSRLGLCSCLLSHFESNFGEATCSFFSPKVRQVAVCFRRRSYKQHDYDEAKRDA